MIPIPQSRPKASLSVVMAAAKAEWEKTNTTPLPSLFVLGVRGYYDSTIGEAGNDINAYDDAFFIISPLSMTSWNGNTDPTRYGVNPRADGKCMARLKTGCWTMRPRMHRGKYQAYGQEESPVTVERIRANGSISRTETGCFGIDLHLGGINGTSSEGCQTVPPDQWEKFRKELNATLHLNKVKKFSYILINGPLT